MKLENVNVLIIKAELKKGKNNKGYIAVDFLDIETADNFTIYSQNLELMKSLKKMTKYNVNLDLKKGKNGLVLMLDAINQELGAI